MSVSFSLTTKYLQRIKRSSGSIVDLKPNQIRCPRLRSPGRGEHDLVRATSLEPIDVDVEPPGIVPVTTREGECEARAGAGRLVDRDGHVARVVTQRPRRRQRGVVVDEVHAQKLLAGGPGGDVREGDGRCALALADVADLAARGEALARGTGHDGGGTGEG